MHSSTVSLPLNDFPTVYSTHLNKSHLPLPSSSPHIHIESIHRYHVVAAAGKSFSGSGTVLEIMHWSKLFRNAYFQGVSTSPISVLGIWPSIPMFYTSKKTLSCELLGGQRISRLVHIRPREPIGQNFSRPWSTLYIRHCCTATGGPAQ